MKKLLALLLTLAMISTMLVFASAEAYTVDGETLKYRSGSGSGLSVSGNKVTLSSPSSNAHWSNGQLIANDSIEDGFTVKIKDIVWDATANNAVTLVYTNYPSTGYCGLLSNTASNFTLLVKKDGSIVLWGDGFNSNHVMGKWTSVCITDKTIGESVTEFTYSLVPNADKSVFTFYVNDLAIYNYTVAGAPDYSIFKNFETKCNFGFMALNGDGSHDTGWGSAITGTLSYVIDEVNSVGAAPVTGGGEGGEGGEIPTPPVDLTFRAGGGSGLSVSGNKVTLNQPTSNSSKPATWSNGMLLAQDDIKDGFTVKIKDIVWDANNNNAVAITYSNHQTAPYVGFTTDKESNFTLLVKRDGSIVLWGNGYNSNHVWGKWTGVCITDKTLGKSVTEFTYKMVPNADKTVYTLRYTSTISTQWHPRHTTTTLFSRSLTPSAASASRFLTVTEAMTPVGEASL